MEFVFAIFCGFPDVLLPVFSADLILFSYHSAGISEQSIGARNRVVVRTGTPAYEACRAGTTNLLLFGF
jgi:hypothetical protein